MHAWKTVIIFASRAYTAVVSALLPPMLSASSRSLLFLRSSLADRALKPGFWLPALRSASRVALTRCLAALPPDKAVAVVKAVGAARSAVGRVRGNVIWLMYGVEYGGVGYDSSPERGGEKERDERGRRSGGGGGGGSNISPGVMLSGGGSGGSGASPGMGGDRGMARQEWLAGAPAPDTPWMGFGSAALVGEWIGGKQRHAFVSPGAPTFHHELTKAAMVHG